MRCGDVLHRKEPAENSPISAALAAVPHRRPPHRKSMNHRIADESLNLAEITSDESLNQTH
jgi:hypothetical protein